MSGLDYQIFFELKNIRNIYIFGAVQMREFIGLKIITQVLVIVDYWLLSHIKANEIG